MPQRSSPRPPLRIALALALLLASAGCATTKVSVSREWSDPALKEDRYQRVMVLAVLPSFNRRQTTEDRIVAELRRQGVTAVRSYDALSEEDAADRERIRAAVAKKGADVLYAVRTASVETEQQVAEGRQQWVPTGTGIDYYGYVTMSFGVYRVPEVHKIVTVTVETTLWDVETARMVWACQSDSVSANATLTTTEVADDYARAVTKKVRPYLRTQ
jgi:hypothetical protein